MSRADLLAAAILALAVATLVWVPRRLYAQVNGAPVSAAHEPWLAAGLLALGLGVFKSGLGGDFGQGLTLALACQAMAAVVYADLRFLVIPDLCSAALLALAGVRAWSTGDWMEAGAGGLTLGVLLAAVAIGFKRLRGVEGLGWGDVKLAVALGALLGPLWAVRAVAAAAICASLALLAVMGLRRRRPAAEPLMAPFGAVLSLAAGALLLWRSR